MGEVIDSRVIKNLVGSNIALVAKGLKEWRLVT